MTVTSKHQKTQLNIHYLDNSTYHTHKTLVHDDDNDGDKYKITSANERHTFGISGVLYI